jgi:hypothetical protein
VGWLVVEILEMMKFVSVILMPLSVNWCSNTHDLISQKSMSSRQLLEGRYSLLSRPMMIFYARVPVLHRRNANRCLVCVTERSVKSVAARASTFISTFELQHQHPSYPDPHRTPVPAKTLRRYVPKL